MALDRLALRRRRRYEPVKASAAFRRLFRRAGPDWRFTGLHGLRSKTWILRPLRTSAKWKRIWALLRSTET